MAVHALAQCRARRHTIQTQCAHEEGVATKALDGIEIILAKTQQAQVAFEDGTVGNTRANRKSRINQGIDIDALEIFANQCQSSVGTEVIGQFFYDKVVILSSPLGLTQDGV